MMYHGVDSLSVVGVAVRPAVIAPNYQIDVNDQSDDSDHQNRNHQVQMHQVTEYSQASEITNLDG